MPTQDLVSRFLDDIYAAAVAPQRWEEVVASFAGMLGRGHAHLNIIDLGSGEIRHSLMHGFDPDMLRLGQDRYFQQDAFAIAARDTMAEAMLAGTGGNVLVSREVITPADLERTEYYADFCARWGINDMLSATAIIERRTALSLVANPDDFRRFDETEKDLVQRLWPDINRAFHLSLKVGVADASRSMGLTWDQARQPVYVVQNGRLSYANPTGERALATSALMVRAGQGLRFRDDAANAALRELERPRTRRNLAGSRRQASVLLDDANDERWLVQMVAMSPREPNGPASWFDVDPGVFITLSPVNAVAATRTGMLESLTQFTAVEKEVLAALADGRTVDEIARSTGRRVSTIRWHVRNLLDKTGMKSLSDLSRFVALLLPF